MRVRSRIERLERRPRLRRLNPDLLDDVVRFTAAAGARALREYQQEVARAIVASVSEGRGDIITVMMARQMGKNQTSAALEHYLLHGYADLGGQIVKAAPTWKPQIVNSKLRLEAEMSGPYTRGMWRPVYGYGLQLGRARILFFSADPVANVVGATADLLLEIDEAQSVDEEKYLRDFRPMASTTNATTVLYGTAWSEDCLLEKQRRHNLALQRTLGRRIHFEYPWEHLAAVNPAYKAFVEAEIARLGADRTVVPGAAHALARRRQGLRASLYSPCRQRQPKRKNGRRWSGRLRWNGWLRPCRSHLDRNLANACHNRRHDHEAANLVGLVSGAKQHGPTAGGSRQVDPSKVSLKRRPGHIIVAGNQVAAGPILRQTEG